MTLDAQRSILKIEKLDKQTFHPPLTKRIKSKTVCNRTFGLLEGTYLQGTS